ncbi:MAG: hypothetical protein JO306_06360 [Gemmatimonadetes bacterium]|nr:hypothetical protein [Gemmatimonadota bacterium]
MLLRRVSILLALSLAACQTTAGPGLHADTRPTEGRVVTGDMVNPYLFTYRSASETRVYIDSIPAAPDAMWAALPGIYQQLGLAITRAEDAKRLIGSQQALRRGRRINGQSISSVLECGRTPAGGPAADSYEVTLNAYSVIVPLASGNSQVQTLVEGLARDPVSNNPAVTCASKGTLEQAIRNALTLRAAAR